MSKPILTSDGSHTLFNKQIGEHYHSIFGAITESGHIFVQAGLGAVKKEKTEINVLEIGLGTGLNAILALRWGEKNNTIINYQAIEAFPLGREIIEKLNYSEVLEMDKECLLTIHSARNQERQISDKFSMSFTEVKLEDAVFLASHFDVVFFDAFSPDVQPEMWTEAAFQKVFKSMKSGAVLTTYSCKGIVKRAMKASGFQIEKLPGPPGKREFLRAQKIE